MRPTRSLVTALIMAAIVLLAFWLRVVRLDAQSLWYDEAVTAQVVQQGIGELARWTADDIQPPLYYATVAAWTQAGGLSEAALRWPSLFFGVLMVVLAWALAARLFGPRAGLVAALLAAVHPLWVYYSQEARMYTLLTALGMVAGYALLRVLAAASTQNGYPKWRLVWWAAFALAAIALLYTHYFAVFLLLAYALFFLVAVWAGRSRPGHPFGGLRASSERVQDATDAEPDHLPVARAGHPFGGLRASSERVQDATDAEPDHLPVTRAGHPERVQDATDAEPNRQRRISPKNPAAYEPPQRDSSLAASENAGRVSDPFRMTDAGSASDRFRMTDAGSASDPFRMTDGGRVSDRFRMTVEGVVVALIVGLAYLPWLPNALRRFQVDASYWQGALKLNEALRHIAISFATGETVLEAQAIPLAWAVASIAAACFAALLAETLRSRKAARERAERGERPDAQSVRWQALLFVLLYLLAPIAAILALSLRTPKFNPRYLMLASPALLLLLAGGLSLPFGVRRADWQRVVALAGLAAVLSISLLALRNWYGDPAFTKDDWRGAAAYVRSQIQPDEAVVLVSGHAAPAWRYYAPDLEPLRLPELEILDVNAVLNGAGAAEALSGQLAGKSGAWLVQWQEEVVDPTGVVAYWLALAGDLQPQQPSFWGLDQLHHFRFAPDAALPAALPPETTVDANYGGQVTLQGVSQPACQPDSDGMPCPIYLFWQAQQPLSSDLKLSATLLDGYGNDLSPALEQRLSAYEYPTFRWQPGVTVLSRLDVLPFPGTPPGDYVLRVGVYEAGGLGSRDMDGEDGQDNGPEAGGESVRPLDLIDRAGAAVGRWAATPFRVDEPTPAVPPQGVGPALAAAPGIELLQGVALANSAAPGTLLKVALWWQAASQPAADYEIRWEWLDPAGALRAWGTTAVAGAGYPTRSWQPGAPLRSHLAAPTPPDAEPGRWTLRVGLSEAGSAGGFAGETVALPVEIRPLERLFSAPPVQFPADAAVGDQITLVGLSSVGEPTAPGATVPVTVVWQAVETPAASYTVFVHLLDASGRVVAQDDRLPQQGERPTDSWLPGEVIVDEYVLTLPAELPAGEYRFEVGLYDASQPDLPRVGEAVVVGRVTVGAE